MGDLENDPRCSTDNTLMRRLNLVSTYIVIAALLASLAKLCKSHSCFFHRGCFCASCRAYCVVCCVCWCVFSRSATCMPSPNLVLVCEYATVLVRQTCLSLRVQRLYRICLFPSLLCGVPSEGAHFQTRLVCRRRKTCIFSLRLSTMVIVFGAENESSFPVHHSVMSSVFVFSLFG